MREKLLLKLLLSGIMLLGIADRLYAQCNIADFTATPIHGSCVQDVQVVVAIPGASGCLATASIRIVGQPTDLDFINLSTHGDGTFNNLPAGDYEVRVYQGSETQGPVGVTLTTIYTPISVNLTLGHLKCA